MTMKNRVYGVDLDGVSLQFIPDFSAFLKQKLNIDYSDDQIKNYYWHKCDLGITESDFWNLFHMYGQQLHRYRPLEPMPGAVEGIKYLMQNAKDVWFITGRPHYAYEQTVDSLEEKFGITSDHIIFSSGKDYKSNVVRRLRIDAFIDDAPHYAEAIASKTRAKCYLYDATYNQEVEEIPGKLIRVSGWEDFINKELKW